jgi:hypothetical protein
LSAGIRAEGRISCSAKVEITLPCLSRIMPLLKAINKSWRLIVPPSRKNQPIKQPILTVWSIKGARHCRIEGETYQPCDPSKTYRGATPARAAHCFSSFAAAQRRACRFHSQEQPHECPLVVPRGRLVLVKNCRILVGGRPLLHYMVQMSGLHSPIFESLRPFSFDQPFGSASRNDLLTFASLS